MKYLPLVFLLFSCVVKDNSTHVYTTVFQNKSSLDVYFSLNEFNEQNSVNKADTVHPILVKSQSKYTFDYVFVPGEHPVLVIDQANTFGYLKLNLRTYDTSMNLITKDLVSVSYNAENLTGKWSHYFYSLPFKRTYSKIDFNDYLNKITDPADNASFLSLYQLSYDKTHYILNTNLNPETLDVFGSNLLVPIFSKYGIQSSQQNFTITDTYWMWY